VIPFHCFVITAFAQRENHGWPKVQPTTASSAALPDVLATRCGIHCRYTKAPDWICNLQDDRPDAWRPNQFVIHVDGPARLYPAGGSGEFILGEICQECPQPLGDWVSADGLIP
jgi:hypothetical protein